MELMKRNEFMPTVLPTARLGQLGLVLSVLSGGYLIMPYWSVMGSMPLLVAKIVFVLVLVGLSGINSSQARKARKGPAATYMPRMAFLGRTALFTSLTIVVLAVLVFH